MAKGIAVPHPASDFNSDEGAPFDIGDNLSAVPVGSKRASASSTRRRSMRVRVRKSTVVEEASSNEEDGLGGKRRPRGTAPARAARASARKRR